MSQRTYLFAALLASLALGHSACRRRPPMAPVAASSASGSAAPAPPPVPAPPPPPKCEAMGEKCASAADTRATVAGTAVTMTPPPGWTYAKEATATVAVAPSGLASLAVAVAAGEEAAKLAPAIESLLTRLAVSGVVVPTLQKRLAKAQDTQDAGGTPVKIWEVDKTRQKGDPSFAGKPATVLVAVTKLGDTVVVAVGVVVKPDAEAEAGPILTAVTSLRGGT
ncbi:MAG: hypothetical protein IT376_08610 [Polyangiaceae bacterium]|nr:hypothetical protein [Polyangiaceae bacterium]